MRCGSTAGGITSTCKDFQSYKRYEHASNLLTPDGCSHIMFAWISLKSLLSWQMNSTSARFCVICFPMPLSIHLRVLRCSSALDRMTMRPGRVLLHHKSVSG